MYAMGWITSHLTIFCFKGESYASNSCFVCYCRSIESMHGFIIVNRYPFKRLVILPLCCNYSEEVVLISVAEFACYQLGLCCHGLATKAHEFSVSRVRLCSITDK